MFFSFAKKYFLYVLNIHFISHSLLGLLQIYFPFFLITLCVSDLMYQPKSKQIVYLLILRYVACVRICVNHTLSVHTSQSHLIKSSAKQSISTDITSKSIYIHHRSDVEIIIIFCWQYFHITLFYNYELMCLRCVIISDDRDTIQHINRLIGMLNGSIKIHRYFATKYNQIIWSVTDRLCIWLCVCMF